MTTIAQIQHRMSAFDTFARTHKDADALQTKWHSLFKSDLGTKAAQSFVQYYRKMRQTKRQRGGMAPLDYTMGPGANVSVYGQFPIEVNTDPASIRNLDVYFHDALTKDCGNPSQAAAFPQPSSGMGNNQVGGKTRKRRQTLKNRKMNRKNRKSVARRQRGGNLGTSLAMHPFLSSTPPNVIQHATHAWNGGPQPFPGHPVQHQWNYVSNGTSGTINPGLITPIGTNFATLAKMDPYQTSQ